MFETLLKTNQSRCRECGTPAGSQGNWRPVRLLGGQSWYPVAITNIQRLDIHKHTQSEDLFRMLLTKKNCSEAEDYFEVCFNTVGSDWTVTQRQFQRYL